MMAKRRKEENDQDDHNAMDIVPHPPDLVIHQILRYLPTKFAIHMSFLSKNWVGLWSSLPVVDFQEETAFDDGIIKFNKLEHTKFINFLVRYLEQRDKDSPLEKLRLHTRYCCEDMTVLDRWLSFAANKSIKELDINLMSFNDQVNTSFSHCFFKLFPHNILCAESISALKLEYVRIKDTNASFPSLKTVVLKHVWFGTSSVTSLISSSPSIEYISVLNCFNEPMLPDNVLKFTSSSLKSLEVSCCDYSIEVRAHANLESFTLVSNRVIREITLDRCRNLKYIKIHARRLDSLELLGCHDSMKATINAPNLSSLAFNGYMKHQIFVETRKLNGGIVAVRDRRPIFEDESRKHFSTLRDFLHKGYGSCSTSLHIMVFDSKALTFPKDLRKNCSPPLTLLKRVELNIVSYETDKIDSEFWDSLLWMAPNATLSPACWRKFSATTL